MEKILCIKETRPATGNDFCIWLLRGGPSLSDLFDGAEPGEQVVLELVEMTQEEFDALPDFTGW